MSSSPNDWQREDFIALLLQYAANVDLEVTPPEKNLILKMAGKAHYDKALAFFNQASDYETIQRLIELRGHFFAGEKGKEQLHNLLLNIFSADEEFSAMEHVVMNSLERILL